MDFIVWLEQSWVILASTISAVTLVWTFFNNTLKSMKNTINQPIVELDKKIDEKFDKLAASIEEKHKNDKCINEALLTMQRRLLYDKITELLLREYVTLHEKQVLFEQFKSYEELGGNSFIKDLMEQVKQLPLENPAEKIREI